MGILLKKLLPVALLFLFIFAGCTPHDESRIKKKEVIPEKYFVPIIVDLHLANSMFSLSSLRRKFPGTDSISNYRDVIAAYGYTLDDFEKTLYYYEDHLDEFVQVYDKANKRLQEVEREVMGDENPLKYDYGEKNNLWTGSTEWHLPREGKRNKIPYKIPVDKKGVYTLTARIRLYRDDQSMNPAATLNFWYDDGSPDGKWIPVRKQNLIKDNQVHLYLLSGSREDDKITHIRGFLIDHENPDTGFVKHADIFDIRVDFKPKQNLPK